MNNFIRDPEVWTKTQEQKNQWKNIKKNFKDFSGWCSPKKRSPLVGKLVVYDDVTTTSYKVRQDEILDVLSKHSKITKCEWLEQTFTVAKLVEIIS